MPSRPRDPLTPRLFGERAFFESRQRGYVSVELTAERMTAHLRTVSDVRDPRATLSTLRSFVVESGRPGAVPA